MFVYQQRLFREYASSIENEDFVASIRKYIDIEVSSILGGQKGKYATPVELPSSKGKRNSNSSSDEEHAIIKKKV